MKKTLPVVKKAVVKELSVTDLNKVVGGSKVQPNGLCKASATSCNASL